MDRTNPRSEGGQVAFHTGLDAGNGSLLVLQDQGNVSTTTAKEAFRAVRLHLEQSTSLSQQQKDLLSSSSSIEHVHQTVADLVAQYESRANSSKTRKWLHKTSETICHYGTVLDVFVQQNPEYVCLVWGTFKLLFSSAVNHAETLKLLAKSTSQIAMRLPRVKMLSELYAGPQMRRAVEDLYVCILEYLLIGYSWVTESKFKHFYHSFTRPVKLQYDDVLGRITDCSNNIMELATLGSQTEVRVMHTSHSSKLNSILSALDTSDRHRETQIEELSDLVSSLGISSERQERKIDLILSLLEASGLGIVELLTRDNSERPYANTFNISLMLTTVPARRALQAGALLDTNQQLSSPQLDQILSTLSLSFQDPDQVYKHHLFLLNRRATTGWRQGTATNSFWLSPQLKRWSSTNGSALVIVKGAFNSRAVIQDFGTSVIHALPSSSSGLSMAWALPGTVSGQAAGTPGVPGTLTPSDLVKYLSYQLLRSSGINPTERTISIRHSQLQSASTFREWLDLFKQLVSSHPARQLYVVVDLSLVAPTATDEQDLDLLRQLNQILADMANSMTTLKVVVLLYEADWVSRIPPEMVDSVVAVTVAKSRPMPVQPRASTMKREIGRRLLKFNSPGHPVSPARRGR
ncbi:hypothetical protein V8F06_013334 [Rhypophila decipiens]